MAAQTPTSSPDINPTGNAGALKPQIQTGGSYDAHSGNVTRIVNDLRVPGALGSYALDFTRYWNSTHNDYQDSAMEWPKDFGMSGWSHSWHWSATYDFKYPEVVLASCGEGGNMVCESDNNQFTTAINITFPDGHTTQYKIVRLEHGDWMAPGSYPQFGPPYTPSERTVWANGGAGVHDHLLMAADGSQFWLTRADGGSVHFVWDATYGLFQAKEVYDPHGLKTTLSYTIGYLTHVQQEGGRYLDITWEPFSGGEYMITRVQSGSAETGITQTVNYYYTQPTGYWTLRHVVYENEPLPGGAPGQKVAATYDYGTCYGDEPCIEAEQSVLPLLKRADDPHYAGAMRIIRYNYRGEHCPPHLVEPWDWPMYVPAQVWAVKSEKTDSGLVVSSFTIECDSGKRREDNGLGGWRMFYYGGSAGTQESTPYGAALCRGYQLGALTDFTRELALPPNLPTERQNFVISNPYHIWDGRGIMTESIVYAHDYSGGPSEIRRVDGSVNYYNRINPGASDPIDPAQGMHNPYNHWVFSETHQINAATSHTTTYTRDARRRVKRIDYHDGSYETFQYDNGALNGFNQVTSHRLPSGAVKTYEYDGRGRLMLEYNSVDRLLDGTNGDIEYTYDALDRVRTKKDGQARVNGKHFSTQMSYNGRHQITRVEYAGIIGAPNNPSVWYGYDAYGNCTSISDELAQYPGDPYHTKRYEYDSYRRCTAYIEPLWAPGWNGAGIVGSRRWDWLYDRWIDGLGQKDATAHTKNEWRIQIGPAFNAVGQRRMTARAHDVQNQIVVEQTGWIQPGNLPVGSWFPSDAFESRSFTYDENGQKSSETDPRGRLTTSDYDNRNRLWKTNETVNTLPRTTETLYDFAGNKTDVIFPDGRSQQWRDYDAFGQALRFIDERNNTTNLSYVWGPMKKLYTVTTHRTRDDGGTEDQPTTFSYDLLGRATQVLFPDGSDEYSTYKFGQLATWKTRKGQTKYIHYDARGREDSHSWIDLDGNCNPATDTAKTPCVDRDWDPASRLTRIENRVSKIQYVYDAAGQVLEEGNTIAGSGGLAAIRYSRYADGATAIMTYPNGHKVRRDYTARGQLASVNYPDANGNVVLQFVQYNYLADGKVDTQQAFNGVESRFDYDGRGMTREVHHRHLSPSLPTYARRNYWRDERDRITAYQKGSDNSLNPMENARGDRYAYDDEGQLTHGWYNALDPAGAVADVQRYDEFHYDALGNRQQWNYLGSRGWMNFARRDNKLNQYWSWENDHPNPPLHWGSAVLHDDNFNQDWVPPGNGVTMADGWLVASYNALNQPVAIYSPANSGNFMWFGYDPLGRCVKRWMASGTGGAPETNPATYFYYEGWNLLSEGQAGAPTERIYVHGNRVDEIVCDFYYPQGQWRYHHYDARGHNILLTGPNGDLVEQYEYDAFGQPYFYDGAGNHIGHSTWGNRFLFTGREYLSDLKLYDYRNRMYQPELGRFMQPDPKHFAAGDYNLYRYCHNDPVNLSDPFGLAPIPVKDDVDQKSREGLGIVRDIMKKSGDGMERAKSTGRDPETGKVFVGEPTEKGKWNRTRTGQTVDIPEPRTGSGINPESGVHAHPDNNQTDGKGNVRTDGKAGPIASNADRQWADSQQRPIYTISGNGKMIERYRPDDSRKTNGGVTERWNGQTWIRLNY